MIEAFAAHLRRRDAGPPSGLTTWNGSSPAQRFAVYRNNVAVSLIGALAAKYPLVEELVGKDYFPGLAGAFMRERMPKAPRLAQYGDDFADFVASFAPLSDWPYLADVARLEAAQLAAAHAADAASLGAEAFAQVEDLARLRVELHPSLRVIVSRFAVAAIADRLEAGGGCEDLDPDRAQTVVIARPRLTVRRLVAPAGTEIFLDALARGGAVADAVEAASGVSGFEPTQAFRLLVEEGLTIQLLISQDTP
jgi:hypothetical protein